MKLRFYDWCRANRFFRRAPVEFEYGKFSLDILDYVQHEMFLRGCYEPETFSLFNSLIKPGDCVVDIGANIGQYAVAAANKVQLSGRVIAVEPNPIVCAALIENARLNSAARCIEIVTSAMARDEDYLTFRIPQAHDMGTTRPCGGGERDSFTTRATPLSTLLNDLQASEINVMKIDTEGQDFEIIASLFERSNFRPRNLIFEYISHAFDYGIAPDDLALYFRGQGYALKTVGGNPYEPHAMLVEDNCWAELASPSSVG